MILEIVSGSRATFDGSGPHSPNRIFSKTAKSLGAARLKGALVG